MVDRGVVHSQTIGRLNKTETVAFGYLCARFEQRVTRTFGYPLHAPSFITAGNGLADEKSGATFWVRPSNKNPGIAAGVLHFVVR